MKSKESMTKTLKTDLKNVVEVSVDELKQWENAFIKIPHEPVHPLNKPLGIDHIALVKDEE